MSRQAAPDNPDRRTLLKVTALAAGGFTSGSAYLAGWTR